MATKYLYIDDEDPASLESYVRAVVGADGDLEIVPERPSNFDQQVQHLLEVLANFDGLILDWQLDDIPAGDGTRVLFRAGALAQELRTRETSNEVKGLPIILWSTKPKLRKSYYGDHTSHDLFDVLYDKESVVDNAQVVNEQLASLAHGYKRITSILSQGVALAELFGINSEVFESLDPRFTGSLSKTERLPIHEYARFILKEVVLRPGPLINEEVLAARLGIDKQESPDWNELLEHVLNRFAYSGPFSDAWPRWWSQLVETNWWRSLGEDLPNLNSLRARERVAVITERTGARGLVAAKPINDSYGDYFRTVCEVTRRPLDPVDGVMIDEKEPKSWQDLRYISLEAALERRGEEEGLRPHPTEMERLKVIRDSRTENAET